MSDPGEIWYAGYQSGSKVKRWIIVTAFVLGGGCGAVLMALAAIWAGVL